jgi:hypothetical protein
LLPPAAEARVGFVASGRVDPVGPMVPRVGRCGFGGRALIDVPVAGVFVCWLPVSVPVTALLLTPPASPPPCATAVAAPVINNDATPRNRIVFVMEVFVIKIAPAMLG